MYAVEIKNKKKKTNIYTYENLGSFRYNRVFFDKTYRRPGVPIESLCILLPKYLCGNPERTKCNLTLFYMSVHNTAQLYIVHIMCS